VRDERVAWWKRGLLVVATLGGIALTPIIVVLLVALALAPSTPDGAAIQRAAVVHPTLVYAVNGEKLTQFEAPFREWVPLDSIPLHVIHALIATEDRRFYEHSGLDLRRTAAAAWRTLWGDPQGGSTITQQLARNLFPARIGTAFTPERKLREMIAATRIERAHTKREILEAYLNTAPFLYNAIGIEMAARTYFSTPTSALTVEEGAMLVAMLKGPAFYSPVRHPDRAVRRRNLVLSQMATVGSLAPAARDSLSRLPLALDFHRQPEHNSTAPHFTAAVRHELEEWAEAYGYDVTRDALVVWTTLDPGIQRDAQAALRRQTERLQAVADVEWAARGMPSFGGADAYARRNGPNAFSYYWNTHPRVVASHTRASGRYEQLVAGGMTAEAAVEALAGDAAFNDSLRAVVTRLEAALVALDPRTGAVRAYVGSRDFDLDEYDHAGVARRQPGSAFKPFVYAAALAAGYGPQDRIRDEAVAIDLGGGRIWRPTNSGRISGAEMTLANALAYSKNTITVRLANEIGIGRVAVTARRMGIRSPLDVVPSLALGTSPVTLLELVGAYGTLLNEGRHARPRLIARIETADGRVLESFEPDARYAIPGRDARTLTAMLRNAVERGTGTGLRAFSLRGQYAGKTGTTQRNADGWFVGMHPDLVAGAWVGFNDQRVGFRSNYWGQGGHNALLLVGDFFQRVEDRFPPSAFPAAPQPLPPFESPSSSDTLELDRYFAQQETESMADFDPYYADPVPTAPARDVAPAYEELGYTPYGAHRRGGTDDPAPEPRPAAPRRADPPEPDPPEPDPPTAPDEPTPREPPPPADRGIEVAPPPSEL